VPYEYVNKHITLEITAYEILCWFEGKLIATHTKSLIAQQKCYIADHYLELYLLKPRAIEHAAPLKKGILPPELADFRDKCKDKNKNEQLVNLMLLSREVDSQILEQAIQETNKLPKPNYTKVKSFINILSFSSSITISENPTDIFENKNCITSNFDDYSFIKNTIEDNKTDIIDEDESDDDEIDDD
jgi:hypothetical protein